MSVRLIAPNGVPYNTLGATCSPEVVAHLSENFHTTALDPQESALRGTIFYLTGKSKNYESLSDAEKAEDWTIRIAVAYSLFTQDKAISAPVGSSADLQSKPVSPFLMVIQNPEESQYIYTAVRTGGFDQSKKLRYIEYVTALALVAETLKTLRLELVINKLNNKVADLLFNKYQVAVDLADKDFLDDKNSQGDSRTLEDYQNPETREVVVEEVANMVDHIHLRRRDEGLTPVNLDFINNIIEFFPAQQQFPDHITNKDQILNLIQLAHGDKALLSFLVNQLQRKILVYVANSRDEVMHKFIQELAQSRLSADGTEAKSFLNDAMSLICQSAFEQQLVIQQASHLQEKIFKLTQTLAGADPQNLNAIQQEYEKLHSLVKDSFADSTKLLQAEQLKELDYKAQFIQPLQLEAKEVEEFSLLMRETQPSVEVEISPPKPSP